MARKNTGCTFPYCDEPRDEDRDTTMCTEHSAAWLRSEAFTKACRSDKVVGWMCLGIEKKAMQELAKHRRGWAKEEARRTGEGER